MRNPRTVISVRQDNYDRLRALGERLPRRRTKPASMNQIIGFLLDNLPHLPKKLYSNPPNGINRAPRARIVPPQRRPMQHDPHVEAMFLFGED